MAEAVSPTNGSAAVVAPPASKAVKNDDDNPTAIKKPARRAKARARKSAKAAKAAKKLGPRNKAFPNSSFQEALVLADAIQSHSGGTGSMRRVTLFGTLNKSPESGPSRMLVTNSSRYGITTGGYQAEHLELTPNGNLATNPDGDPRERLKARFDLAIGAIPPFKVLYDKFAGHKLPTRAVMHDALREAGIPEEDLEECGDMFIVNSKYLGLLRVISGAERLITLEHALEEQPSTGKVVEFAPVKPGAAAPPASTETDDWSKICFYMTPIGEEGSDQRRHSDLFLSCVVEPAIETLGLKIVRADQIGKSGMIGAQIVEHVLRSRLVVVDLSFHNPNVFYELCLRHVSGLPTVHIIRQADKIPFDIAQCRTIEIDTTDIYSLVPKLETHRSEIALHARQALENESQTADNPITVFSPGLKLNIPSLAASKRSSERAG